MWQMDGSDGCVFGAISLRDKQGHIMRILEGQALDWRLCRQKEALEKILSKLVICPQVHFRNHSGSYVIRAWETK